MIKFVAYCVKIIVVISISISVEANMNKEVLVLDSNSSIPRNYRDYSNLSAVRKAGVSILGLTELAISGSGQFSEQGLKYILAQKNTKKPVYIIDLRLESHGFIQGIAISWYAIRNTGNVGRNENEIYAREQWLLSSILHKTVKVYLHKQAAEDLVNFGDFESIYVERALSEQQLVEQYGVNYKRVYVVDHTKPSTATMQDFLQFYRKLPKDAEIHVHCRAGKGRSTTFMIILDILQNAKLVTLEDIIKRNYLIGGTNLANTVFSPEKKWKQELSNNRKEFLQKFYDYVRNNDIYSVEWR